MLLPFVPTELLQLILVSCIGLNLRFPQFLVILTLSFQLLFCLKQMPFNLAEGNVNFFCFVLPKTFIYIDTAVQKRLGKISL